MSKIWGGIKMENYKNLEKIKEELNQAENKIKSFFNQKRILVGLDEIPIAKLGGYLMALEDINSMKTKKENKR